MDESEANGNTKWDNLLTAVKTFIGALIADPLILSNSSVSIVTYNSGANLICE